MESAFTHIADIDVQLVEALVQVLPDPDLWSIQRREKINSALQQSRSLTIRNNSGKLNETDTFVDDPIRNSIPEIEPFIDLIKELGFGEKVGRITFAYLPAGRKVHPHVDKGKYLETYTRFMIPLTTNPGVEFTVDKKPYRPEIGKVYLFDNQKEHSTVNDGETGRVLLIVDVTQA